MTTTRLVDVLSHLRVAVIRLTLFHGLGRTLAALALGLAGAMLLDFLLRLPAIPRTMLNLAMFVSIAFVAWRFLLRPARRPPALEDIAGRIESLHPIFQDRLRSAIDFTRHPSGGSEQMQSRVINEANAIALEVPIREILEKKPAHRWLGLGLLLTVALVSSMAMLNPSLRSIALSRLVNPFTGASWPTRVAISPISGLPERIAAGESIEINVTVERGDSARLSPILHIRDEKGVERQEYLNRVDGSNYSAMLSTRSSESSEDQYLDLWVTAGDGKTGRARVVVAPRPALMSFVATIVPPAYVPNGEARSVDLSQDELIALQGSRVTLSAEFSRELSEGGLKSKAIVGEELPDWITANRRAFESSFIVRESMRFSLTATSTDGVKSAGGAEYAIEAHPDTLPRITIENPRDGEDRTPEAVVPLIAAVEDDIGIDKVSLHVRKLGASESGWTIDLVSENQPLAVDSPIAWQTASATSSRLNFDWVLGKLTNANLQGGDVLEFWFSALDNYEFDGRRHEPVESAHFRLSIITQEQLTARAADQLRQARAAITQIKSTNDRTQAETSDLQNDVKEKSELDQADLTVASRLQQQQSGAAATARQAANRLEELAKALEENRSSANEIKSLAEDVAKRLNNVADDPMRKAAQDLAQGAQSQKNPDQRNQSLDSAQSNQARASQSLQSMLDQMADVGTLSQMIESIGRLLDEQRKLTEKSGDLMRSNAGKNPRDMSASDRAELEKLSKEQNELAQKTDELIKQLEQAARDSEKTDKAGSDAMKQAAKSGSSQQVSQSQRSASGSMKQNHQSSTQQSQQQAELGLLKMQTHLREAEQKKLAELQKKLAELAEQIANLIRRQSGHNLDNLTLQGADRLKVIGDEALAELIKLSEREEIGPIRPDQTRMISAQTQTHRNTRDIATTAGTLPDGAEPSARLNRAATLMERALVLLRESKLDPAFEPQSQALVALRDAEKIIQEQKQKVEEQLEKQKKEAIRQQYIRIRDEQIRLRDETERLEKSRNPEGKLSRADSVRLGQLPGEQATLVEQMKSIDEDLQSLGSVVFVWMGNRVQEQMESTRAMLQEGRTNDPTLRQHERVISNLNKLIDSLEVKPHENRFESGGGSQGGQGQGQQPPRMPTEAELRLLRALQVDINESTIEIDNQRRENPEIKIDEPLVDVASEQSALRRVLDEMLTNSSQGKIKLGPEKTNVEAMPEEADDAAIDDHEFEEDLLGQAAGAENAERDIARIGDRMSRSRQRLEVGRDPGEVTQKVQARILKDFDMLIEMARQQQPDSSASSQQQQGDQSSQAQDPSKGQAEAQNQGEQTNNSSTPARDSTASGRGNGSNSPSTDIEQTAQEWGKISPRLRGPVLESRDDEIVERYRKLVEDYTRAVSTEASGGSSEGSN